MSFRMNREHEETFSDDGVFNAVAYVDFVWTIYQDWYYDKLVNEFLPEEEGEARKRLPLFSVYCLKGLYFADEEGDENLARQQISDYISSRGEKRGERFWVVGEGEPLHSEDEGLIEKQTQMMQERFLKEGFKNKADLD